MYLCLYHPENGRDTDDVINYKIVVNNTFLVPTLTFETTIY